MIMKPYCSQFYPVMNSFFQKGLLLLSVLSLSLPVYSQQEWHKDKPHHLSLFLGGTHVLDVDKDGATIGFDYEYRVNDVLGIGFVAEHATTEIFANTLIAVADIHTPSGLIIQMGPGVEFGDKHDRFIFRIGGLYEFEFESFTLSPQLHFDAAENESDSLVFGFAIGKSF